MFKNRILKKLGAGLMAGLCVFSMLGTNLSGSLSASAASSSTENAAFPSAGTVIAKAAELLGTPYAFGNKGYWGCYNQGEYSELSVSTIKNLGIDCSGLVYYWCELERQKYKAYTQKEKEFPPLWENKVFQPVRNMIIRQVSGMEIRHYEIDSEKQLNQTENAMLTNTIFSLFTNLSRCIADDYNQNFNSSRMSVDRKLRRMIHDKKQALGQKEDLIHEQSY